MTAAVQAIEAESGAVGALVNNAGYSQSGAIETLSMDDLRRQFETNVFGLVRMTQLVLPGMRAAGSGRIVNMSSMGGNFVFPGGGAYHASKYAVEAISDALRFEVKGFGIGVTVIQPGAIRTEFASTVKAAAAGGRGALRGVQRRGRQGHQRRLREGPAREAGRRARRRRQGGREGDRRQAGADPDARHAVRAPADHAEAAAARPRLGRVRRHAVPAPALIAVLMRLAGAPLRGRRSCTSTSPFGGPIDRRRNRPAPARPAAGRRASSTRSGSS